MDIKKCIKESFCIIGKEGSTIDGLHKVYRPLYTLLGKITQSHTRVLLRCSKYT